MSIATLIHTAIDLTGTEEQLKEALHDHGFHRCRGSADTNLCYKDRFCRVGIYARVSCTVYDNTVQMRVVAGRTSYEGEKLFEVLNFIAGKFSGRVV